MPIILFVLLSMTTFSLFPAQRANMLVIAEADHKIRLAEQTLMNAEYALIRAQLEEQDEDDIEQDRNKIMYTIRK